LTEKRYAGGARNVGIENAKGQFIGFVDSDDWIDTNMLKRMTSSLIKTDSDIAVCGVITELDSPFDQVNRYVYEFENVITGKLALDIMSREFTVDISISPIVCNKIYRAKFIQDNSIRFIENNYNEDDVFNYIAFSQARNVVIVPDTFYHYYQRQDSITHTFSKKHIDDLFRAFEYIREYLMKSDQFVNNSKGFYAFFEKCLHFILTILMNTEKDTKVQNEYLKYLLSTSNNMPFLYEYLSFIDLRRIRKFLNPLKE
jgi:glycosyltransferase involved in cell wall biosynthesis